MTRRHHTQAPQGADGTCRDRRGPRGERRPGWVRPFVRANRAIRASARLIARTLREVSASERRVERRPVGTSRKLQAASGRLVDASARLARAARELARTNEWIARDPENSASAPRLLVETTASWVEVAAWLGEVADDVFAFHRDVLEGLETGALVPERPAGRRPRIVLAPRPAPVRAFLRLRQPRVADRIAAILLRRRRTRRPAAVTVPRVTDQGRAPPLPPVCPF
jgi:hypothetical protein